MAEMCLLVPASGSTSSPGLLGCNWRKPGVAGQSIQQKQQELTKDPPPKPTFL